MQINLGYDAFALARTRVHDVAHELAEAETRTSRQVGHLLDGGWAGSAADAFDDAWHDWLAGAHQVHEALLQIETALASTERELTARDEDALAQLAILRAAVQR